MNFDQIIVYKVVHTLCPLVKPNFSIFGLSLRFLIKNSPVEVIKLIKSFGLLLWTTRPFVPAQLTIAKMVPLMLSQMLGRVPVLFHIHCEIQVSLVLTQVLSELPCSGQGSLYMGGVGFDLGQK